MLALGLLFVVFIAGNADAKPVCYLVTEGNPHAYPLLRCDTVTIVTRAEWGANACKSVNYMGTPVSVVFIHHTAMSECHTQDACAEEMRVIQRFHQVDRGWDDIGYNFLIGQDGRAYEGRAWDRIGAHTKGWNDVAIAFSIMGDFSNKLPNAAALDAVKAMIDLGIKLGKITPNYKLYGHRDAGTTECPGQTLYELIRTWDHFGRVGDQPPVKPTPIPYRPTASTGGNY
ncbi:peptidoglycan-recognition protein SC2-like isoform X2 [Dreissena polymorpha]|uniref:peptidoglycan-recognition protein SC2-like isoform X2 n=1 Tax=Dreissena polymorpha TaxID=45954 RepID=UPI00226521AD|nr:peptidoglycan-recognition protein SC2-like isoform X2 [Dreissena polymorpha]